jgi:hypothetical protein
MTEAQWQSIKSKDSRYDETHFDRAIGRVVQEVKGFPVCLHLGSPVSAFRRSCIKGHANPDGLGGVKICCDCGPGNCGDYSPEED